MKQTVQSSTPTENRKIQHSTTIRGFIKGNRFKKMIDSVSPLQFLRFSQLRKMTKGEKKVDFKTKPPNLPGYVFSNFELQVRDWFVR